ncbi:HSP20-like chaperone [Aspergillus desertorum]
MSTIRQLNQATLFWDSDSNTEEHRFSFHPHFTHHPDHHQFTTDDEEMFCGRRGRGGRGGHRGRHASPHLRRHRDDNNDHDEETIVLDAEIEISSSDSSDTEDDKPRGSRPHRGHKGHGKHGAFYGKWKGKGRGGFGHRFEHGHHWGEVRHGRFGPFGGFHPQEEFGPPDFNKHFGPHRGPHGFGHRGGFGPRGGHGPHPYWRGCHRHMRGFKHGGQSGSPSGLGPRGPGPWGRFGFKDNKPEEFEPEVDVFDTPDAFVIHASLPGAKKDATEVKWDARKFELSITGVIERSGDAELLESLALDERRVGAFDRKVRLGSTAHPVEVNADEIVAKMEDGVLSVRLPKVESDLVVVTKVDIQ